MFLIAISGFFIHKYNSKVLHFIGMVLGTAVAYAFGTAWYCFETQNGVVAALMVCVFPFIIGDCIKMILAIVIGSKMKNSIGIL